MNLSHIHDIHYRWGLPFCTQVTWAEFPMICNPHHHHCYPCPLLSSFFSRTSIHFFPLDCHFMVSQLLFILHRRLFGILPSNPSKCITSTHPPFLFVLLIPPIYTMSVKHVTWEVGAPLGIPLQCHHTLICLLRFHIDFVLNKGKHKKNEVPGVTWKKKKKNNF